MTSIIQSNRERKSRLDEGLVKRLNKEPEENTENTKKDINDIQPTITGDITPITDKKMYDEIIKFGESHFDKNWRPIFRDNLMVGTDVYASIIVDMYLKSINSEYRLARLRDVEKSSSTLGNYMTDVGIVLRDPGPTARTLKGKTDLHYEYEKKIQHPEYPAWLDLRGLKINFNGYISITEESVIVHDDLFEKIREYKYVDSHGLPSIMKFETKLEREKEIVKSSISAVRATISNDALLLHNYLRSYNDDGIILISKGGKNG